jgi:hypothetical protein
MELTLTVPDMANLSRTDAQILFAIKLFEAEKLSLGKAAEVAGLSYQLFYRFYQYRAAGPLAISMPCCYYYPRSGGRV